MVEMGLSMSARPADFVIDGRLEWPAQLLVRIPHLNLVNIRVSEVPDRVVWLSNTGKETIFSVHQVWDDLRAHASKVVWWHLIWFPKRIPKHCFTLWLAVRASPMVS